MSRNMEDAVKVEPFPDDEQRVGNNEASLSTELNLSPCEDYQYFDDPSSSPPPDSKESHHRTYEPSRVYVTQHSTNRQSAIATAPSIDSNGLIGLVSFISDIKHEILGEIRRVRETQEQILARQKSLQESVQKLQSIVRIQGFGPARREVPSANTQRSNNDSSNYETSERSRSINNNMAPNTAPTLSSSVSHNDAQEINTGLSRKRNADMSDSSTVGPNWSTLNYSLNNQMPVASQLLRSVVEPSVIPCSESGKYLLGGIDGLVRDFSDYQQALKRTLIRCAKKPASRGKVLCSALLRMEFTHVELATQNITGNTRDPQTNKKIKIPKLNEHIVRAIFQQARIQFSEFQDWYTDTKCITVSLLNDVCKGSRHKH